MTTAAAGFERVLTKFSSRLTKEEVAKFKFTDLPDVHQTILDIQEEQAGHKGMRNLTRVLAFVEAMDQFGKVVEIFLNTSSLLCFIWGPVKFLLQVASVWADSFDVLLDAYQQIAESIPLLLQFRSLFEKSPEMGKVLEVIYEDILEFHQSALRMFGKSTLRQFFRAAWKDFNSKFHHILGDLQRHKSLIESQANILQIQEAQEARNVTIDSFSKLLQANTLQVQEAQIARTAIESSFIKVFQSERNKQYIALQNWLSAVNIKVDHQGYTTMRHENTGHWILNNDIIKEWINPDKSTIPMVWLNGIPGAGKTILASRIIEEIQKDSQVSVLFFYCKHRDCQRNTFVAVVRSVLAQLLLHDKDQDLLPFLYEQSLGSGEISLQSHKLCESLLETALKSLPGHARVYFVIDGIDECVDSERKLILSTFTSLIDSNRQSGKFRALFVSQYEPNIKVLLRSAEMIRITSKNNEEDIREYTTQWTSNIQTKFTGLPIEKQELITSSVCDGAKGMFLFAKLVMTNLHSQTTLSQLYRELQPEYFPKGLDQAYARIVERIYFNENISEREQAQRLLGWLVSAKRPLKWHEIQGALSINVEYQTVDFKQSLVMDIEVLCGSLVERLPGDRIELVHSTAKTYLVQDDYINLAKEEGKLTALCMQYLTFDSFSPEEPLAEEERLQLVKSGFYAFQDYAALHWLDHLECFLKTLGLKDLAYLDVLGPISEDYLILYGAGHKLLDESSQGLDVKCEHVRENPSFETFQLLINHTRHLRNENEDLAALGCNLSEAISSSRKQIEDMSQSSTMRSGLQQSLETFYGTNRFKCPRHLCFYFHEGFPTATHRDQHVVRHDRPFCCSHDGCSRVHTGFSIEKELKNHLRKYHPDPDSLSWKFPKLQSLSEAPKNKNAITFQCDQCSKKFTKSSTLRSHIRTHTDERPFVCTICEQSFAREHDLKRHKPVHSGEKKFVCRGDLKDGKQWGCGRSYPREDALKRHFRSEAGQLCQKPLREEEAINQQLAGFEHDAFLRNAFPLGLDEFRDETKSHEIDHYQVDEDVTLFAT